MIDSVILLIVMMGDHLYGGDRASSYRFPKPYSQKIRCRICSLLCFIVALSPITTSLREASSWFSAVKIAIESCSPSFEGRSRRKGAPIPPSVQHPTNGAVGFDSCRWRSVKLGHVKYAHGLANIHSRSQAHNAIRGVFTLTHAYPESSTLHGHLQLILHGRQRKKLIGYSISQDRNLKSNHHICPRDRDSRRQDRTTRRS